MLQKREAVGSVLLMAPQTGQGRAPVSDIAGRIVALCDEVNVRGHAIRILGPTEDSASSARLKSVVDAVERERPACVLRLFIEDAAHEYLIRWPKDGMQDYGEVVAIDDCPVARHLVEKLGIERATVSPLCEGGLVLRVGDALILSSAMELSDELRETCQRFRSFVIPHPFTSDIYRKGYGPSLFALTHIDLDCNVALSKSGQVLLLVGDLYLRVYSDAVRALAKDLAATVFEVPQEEVERRVLNFVHLPPLDVIIPGDCPATQAFLARQIGEEHVITVTIDECFNYNGGRGGLGCMSTVINAVHLHT